MKYIFYGLALVGGMGLAVQVACNVELRSRMNHPMQAAFASFAVGALATFLYIALGRFPVPAAERLATVPPAAWIGGVLGAFYVWVTIVAAPRNGAAVTLAIAVAGQMLAALVLDQFGAIGLPRHPATTLRLAGVALVICGAALNAVSASI